MHSEEYTKYVKEMRDWLDSQEHLPKDVGDHLLYRFAHSCYFNTEKAKKAAELFFTIRGNAPELLSDRDPLALHMQKFAKFVNMAAVDISGNRKLWIWQLNDPGLDNYDYVLDAKFFILTTDAWLLEEEQRFYENDVIFMDLKDVSLKMLTKLNMSVARKLMKYQQEAMPIRLKSIHLVNTPPVIDKLFMFIKPLLNKEVAEMIHFHQPNSDTLYEFFTKDELPADYGGTLNTMSSMNPAMMSVVEKKRELLIKKNLWVATKKNKKSSAPVPEHVSFRSLVID